MKGINLLTAVPVLLVTSALAACSGRAETPSAAVVGQPDVVLLSVDTLRHDSLQVFAEGAASLPHLDALAAEAACFARAYSTASWTLPSHASLLTGLYPGRHGAIAPGTRLQDDAVTLAQVLGDQGYETVAFTDGGFVHRSFGLGRGFRRYDAHRRRQGASPRLPRNGRPAEVPGQALFDRALAFLAQREVDRPLFLFLHTFSVHDYFRVHPWAAQQLPGTAFAAGGHYLSCALGQKEGTAVDWRRMQELYQAELHHLDEAVGRLRAALQERSRPTLFVLVSDHGEGFEPERSRIHHAGRLHEDLIRVPLLMHGPGIAPRVVTEPVSLVDLMPTLVDWLDYPVPADLDGVSLQPVLRGGTLPLRRLFAEEHHHRWQDGRRVAVKTRPRTLQSLAVLEGDLWWIEDSRAPAQLYDMRRDPRQHEPLPPEDHAAAAALRAAARERFERRTASSERVEDAALDAQLEALGYLQDEAAEGPREEEQ